MAKLIVESAEETFFRVISEPDRQTVLSEALDNAIGRLSERSRTLFLQHYYDKIEYFDLDLLHHLKDGQAENIVHNARRTLSNNPQLRSLFNEGRGAASH